MIVRMRNSDSIIVVIVPVGATGFDELLLLLLLPGFFELELELFFVDDILLPFHSINTLTIKLINTMTI